MQMDAPIGEREAAPLLTPNNPAADHKDYELPGGVVIKFQKGAMELGRNGCTTEEVLNVLIDHIGGFQAGPFKCRENAIALTHIETAKLWILERARARVEQGLKGREGAHK